MNIDDLKQQQVEVEKQFNERDKMRQDVEAEVHKLQGEWRLLDRLIKELSMKLSPEPVKVPVQQEPDTQATEEVTPEVTNG